MEINEILKQIKAFFIKERINIYDVLLVNDKEGITYYQPCLKDGELFINLYGHERIYSNVINFSDFYVKDFNFDKDYTKDREMQLDARKTLALYLEKKLIKEINELEPNKIRFFNPNLVKYTNEEKEGKIIKFPKKR